MANYGAYSRRMANDGAGPYVIKVHGKVERHWEPELQMQLSYAQTELGVVSTLTGQLPDQAALLGALGRLTMWGYLIILVRYDLASYEDRAPFSEA